MRRIALISLTSAALAACSDPISPSADARPTPPSLSLKSGGAVIDIGVLPDMTRSAAYDINNNGQVVGHSSTPAGGIRAFLWTASSGMKPLRAPMGSGDTYAFSINDLNQIAGAVVDATGAAHAVVWRGTQVIDLGTLRGGNFSIGLGINRSGAVVGYSNTTPTGTPHAFLYSADRGIVDLGTLGGAESMAMAINDGGRVVGTAQTAARASYAFSWTSRSGMKQLPVPAGAAGTTALAVNGAGDVVGYAFMSDNTTRAYVWLASKRGTYQTATPLDGLTTGSSSIAFGINANREIVGYSKDLDAASGEHYVAVYWKQKSDGTYKTTTMNMPLGGESAYGQAINDKPDGAARVAGIIMAPDGATRAAIWQ